MCSSALLMALLMGWGLVAPASAANIAYNASLGLGHSDNIRRVPAGEEEEDIVAVGLQFSLDQKSSRLQADAVGNFSYAEYLDDTYDSELLGNFAGFARFGLVPERFEWVVADNYGQVLGDPFAPATPDNRENINFFTTGPDFTAAFGSATRLRLGGRYSLTTYEDRPFDSDTVSGEISLVRLLSSVSNVSLNVRAAQIEYDQAALNADYDQSEAFIRYHATGARTHLELDVGYTEVDQEAAADSEDGLLLRLNVSRRLTAATTAILDAGREFSNSGTAFAAMQSGVGIGLETTAGLQTVQPFTDDHVSLAWQFLRNRTGMTLAAIWSDQSYELNSEQDQTLTTLRADFRRQLSPRTSLSLDAQYAQVDFNLVSTPVINQGSNDYDEWNAGISFEWHLSAAVSLTTRYDHSNRSGDRSTAEYEENRIWLFLQYGRGEPREQFDQPEFGVDQRSPQP